MSKVQIRVRITNSSWKIDEVDQHEKTIYLFSLWKMFLLSQESTSSKRV